MAQIKLDKIDINFTHRETIPEKILTDTFSFINTNSMILTNTRYF